MLEWMLPLTLLLSTAAALFSLLVWLRGGRTGAGLLTQPVLREEFDRSRQQGEEQARLARKELGDNQKAFQETVTKLFGDLAVSLNDNVRGFGDRLETALRTVENRFAAIGSKLDADLKAMGEEATRSRDALRQTIDQRLSDAATAQGTAAKHLREELTNTLTTRLAAMQSSLSQSAGDLRAELTTGLGHMAKSMTDVLGQFGAHQKEQLEAVGQELKALTERHEKGQADLRVAVESRLDALRNENSLKLDEMRRTVDEKLQTTLEQRLGESFKSVVEQLERVHKGIGEMQSLATGVGDLKKVLSNVSVRGALGEIQLAMLLDQFLSPEQVIKNANVRENSSERVEFAVKLPGREADREVLLPIDAKFPQEDYERLVAASERADVDAMAEAAKALENRIKQFARTIRDKYIHPPRTTDFAILFLPTEGLYAEVLRRPGLFEHLQREFHVTIAGPTTLTAFLNALQMGFRSLAIEKRSSEVWKVLGAIRNEFSRYNAVVDKIAKQLHRTATTVETLGGRTKTMNQKLREVETLPDGSAQELLGLSQEVLDEGERVEGVEGT